MSPTTGPERAPTTLVPVGGTVGARLTFRFFFSSCEHCGGSTRFHRAFSTFRGAGDAAATFGMATVTTNRWSWRLSVFPHQRDLRIYFIIIVELDTKDGSSWMGFDGVFCDWTVSKRYTCKRNVCEIDKQCLSWHYLTRVT